MTQEERIRELHNRAEKLQRAADGRRLAVLGSVSVFFAALLTVSLNLIGGLSENIRESSFTGASLLSSDSGGYVLVAVAFFMLGALISVLLIRYQRRKHRLNDPGFDNRHVEEEIER